MVSFTGDGRGVPVFRVIFNHAENDAVLAK